MSLAAMNWTPVSMHKVILAWLRAERGTNIAGLLSQLPAAVWSPGLSNLLDHADLSDPEENRARLRLLYMIRNIFVVELPPDTKWYEVHSLTDGELEELRAINHPGWTDPNDKNEIAKVAARRNLHLTEPPPNWEPPILWGHSRAGPFTIIEGNTRLTAYTASGRADLNIPVFVGLSPMSCYWHILDNCGVLM